MTISRLFATVAIATIASLGATQGQTQINLPTPAEFPPESFDGRQFVDSAGCAFIRAGVDGNVSWVPRMTRSREQVCGMQPTFSDSRVAAASPDSAEEQSKARPDETASREKPAAAGSERPAQDGAEAEKKVVKAPAPKPERQAETTRSAAESAGEPAAKTVQAASDKGRTACPDASPVAQRYMKSGRGDVRCGPQDAPHVTYGKGGSDARRMAVTAPPATTKAPKTKARFETRAAAPRPSKLTPKPGTHRKTATLRVVPRHVYENKVASTSGIRVPEGYEPVWDDDRLNTRRAYQTREGQAQTDLVWTKTVPRVLVERGTGRDMHHRYPGLVHHYTSFAEQRAAGVPVQTSGKVVPDPVVSSRNKVHNRAGGTMAQSQPKASRSSSEPALSTRSAGTETRDAPASHRYVQAGMFGQPGNAERAARRISGAGLPARMGKLTRGGKSYRLVLAGPFETQDQLKGALRQVRALGFGDAFPRK